MPTTRHGDDVLYFIDTSVLLRAGLGDSAAAADWFEASVAQHFNLAGSRLLATEARRVVINRTLRGLPVDEAAIEDILALIAFSPLDDRLAAEAEVLEHNLRAADAMHIATALRLAKDGCTVVVVSHDEQMLGAARALGLDWQDPVTDDPAR
jgi:predicted nucleic acid-binding protein